jgi:serine/threonine protein kinase
MYCNYCRANNPDDSRYCARCGRSLVPTVPPETKPDTLSLASTELGLAPGTLLISRYRIIKELGAGGMGVVYQAQDEKLDMPVAIKVLRDVLSRDPGSVKRLIAEARHSMILSHANVVRVHNFEDGETSKFLVMEYVEGETLGHRLARENKLSEDDTKSIAIEVCKGLEHAHAKNVIHRDLKPGNVLLGKDGSIKLADFGIARICRDSMSRLTSQQSSGTLLYMSPEQLAGKSTEASDVYSLGVMLYEMLSGEPPFSTGDIPYQIREVVPEALGNVSKEMNAIVMRCLEKKAEKRFSSVRELREELEGKSEAKRDEERRRAEEQQRLEQEQKQAADKQRQEEMRRSEEGKRAEEERGRQVGRLLAQGQAAFDIADYPGALSHWEEAQKLSPSNVPVVSAIALARRKLAEVQAKQREMAEQDQRRRMEEQKRAEEKQEVKQEVKQQETIIAPPPPKPRISKSRRLWIGGAALVVLVILGAALWDEYGPDSEVIVEPPPPDGGKGGDKGKTGTGGQQSPKEDYAPPGMNSWSDSDGLVTVPYPNTWQVDSQGIANLQQTAPWYSFAALDMVTHMGVEVYIMEGVTSVQGVLNNMMQAAARLKIVLNIGQMENSSVGNRGATAVQFTMAGMQGMVTGWVYITQAAGSSVCVVVSSPPAIYNAAVPTFRQILSQTRVQY